MRAASPPTFVLASLSPPTQIIEPKLELRPIVSAEAVRQQSAASQLEPINRDYTLHKLSEFAPYKSAPIDREEEPLFYLRSVGQVDVYKEKCFQTKLLRATPRFHQVTSEDVDWGKRQASKREWNIDARSKNLCPLCGELLTEGRYICNSHGKTYYRLLKSRVAPLNQPQKANIKVVGLKESTLPGDARLMWFLHGETEWVEMSRRELVQMYRRDGLPIILSDEERDEIRKMSRKNAMRHLMARKRWYMEKRMVAACHPNAPYEARSLEMILSESRLFPN